MRMRRDPLDTAIAQAARTLPEAPEDATFAARVLAAAAVARQDASAPFAPQAIAWPRTLLHGAVGFAFAASMIAAAVLVPRATSNVTPSYALDPLEVAFAGGSAEGGQP